MEILQQIYNSLENIFPNFAWEFWFPCCCNLLIFLGGIALTFGVIKIFDSSRKRNAPIYYNPPSFPSPSRASQRYDDKHENDGGWTDETIRMYNLLKTSEERREREEEEKERRQREDDDD